MPILFPADVRAVTCLFSSLQMSLQTSVLTSVSGFHLSVSLLALIFCHTTIKKTSFLPFCKPVPGGMEILNVGWEEGMC